MGIITKGMGAVIKKMKPNVPKTKYDKSLRDLKLSLQKLKGSKAKTDQTIFEVKNPKFKGKDFTFASSKKKTMKESDRKKQIMRDNKKVIGKMFKKALKGDK
jgi:hypothetical protein